VKKARKASAIATALVIAAVGVAPQASAHGFRDVVQRLANEASVQQDGAADRAATTQNGAANGSAIQQSGDNLTANVQQNGDGNTAAIRQFGRNSTGSITQNGSGNDACLIQVGRNVNGEIVQNGDNQSTGLLQTRHRSIPIPVEMCQSHDRRHAAGFLMRTARLALIASRR